MTIGDQESPRPAGYRPARRTWRRRLVAGGVSVAMSLTLLGVTPASAESDSQPRAPRTAVLPPPPQVRGLDFLLGAYKCAYTPPPGLDPAVVYMTTRRALDGHYYYIDIVIVPGDVHGLLLYGWNPVNGNFIGQYHDNWGSSGTSVSPGWQDGHLIFSGPLIQVIAPSATGVAPGVPMSLKDDYTVPDPGHYIDVQTITLEDGSTGVGSYDCHRR